MKVILMDNVKDLGDAGDILEVKKGFFRNYLLPRNLAVEAHPKNVKALNHQKSLLDVKIAKGLIDAKKAGEKLETLSLTLSRKAGEQDKLFGSVTDMDIAAALKDKGFDVDRKQIILDEPIKALGVYQIPVKLHSDLETKIKVWVIKE